MRSPLLAAALLLSLAAGDVFAATSPSPLPQKPGRDFVGASPDYYRPEDFPGSCNGTACGDRVRVADPFEIKAGSANLQLATVYQLYATGSGSSSASPTQLTLTFANGAPPLNFPYANDGTVKYRAFVFGAGSSGGTLITFLDALSCSSSTVCTATLDNSIVTTVSNTQVLLYPDMGTNSIGNSNVVTYQPISTANVTYPISDGVPQSVIDNAMQSGTLTSVNLLNVCRITLTNGLFNVQVSQSGTDIESTIEVNGAGAGGGLYTGTIIGENGTTIAYAYPACGTAISATADYALWGPYLFQPSDATAPAKFIAIPLIGPKPAATFIGNPPLWTQIASVIDPFNITLTSTASVSIPTTSTTAMAGGHLLICHDDEIPVTKAFQAAARNKYQRRHKVYLAKHYCMATFAGSNNDGTAISSALSYGEGSLDFPVGGTSSGMLYFFHGPAPLDAKPLTIPEVEINPLENLAQCNNNPVSCTITFVGNSQFTQFTSGLSQIDNWAVKICSLAKRQLAPKPVYCNFMGVGGSAWLDFDPFGPSGIPAQNTSNGWYTSSSTQWINIVRDGNGLPAGGTQSMSGCPDSIIAQFTNVDAAGFSLGAMVQSVNYTQGSSWAAGSLACKTTPDWLFALDGAQPLGDPGINETGPIANDYPSRMIRGFVKACALKLANGNCPGLVSDVSRVAHIVVDGYDPEKVPMRQSDDTPPQNFPENAFPVTWPGYVSDGWSWAHAITFSPSTGVCTILAASSFANNLANAQCTWAMLGNNELDYLIGNPNGTFDSGSPTQAAVDYPGNELRLFFNQANNSATGSLAGMMDYEIDAWNFNISGLTGTSGTNTITCSPKCVNYKHLGSLVTGTNIPAGTYIGSTSNTPAINTAGTSFTLVTSTGAASNLTGNITSGTANLSLVEVPRTTTGQYGFACTTNAGGPNRTIINPVFEVRGSYLTYNLCGGAGPNIVQAYAGGFGGLFQPTISVPSFTGNVGVNFTSDGGCCGSSSMQAMPEYPQYAASYAWKDLYGWCTPSSPAIATILSPWFGQCANHRGSLGSKIEDVSLGNVQLSAGPNVVRGYFDVLPTTGNSLMVPNGIAAYQVTPAGTLATLTITLPAVFPANQALTIGFDQIISALTLSANTGQTVNGAPTSATANSSIRFLFDGTVWHRQQ